MKKGLRILIAAWFLFLCPCLTVFATEATEHDTSSVEVSYEAGGRYVLELHVSDGGTVLDGQKEIRSGTLQYELKKNDTKRLRVLPDEHYELSYIYLRNTKDDLWKDVTNDYKNNVIDIKMVKPFNEMRIAFRYKSDPILKEKDSESYRLWLVVAVLLSLTALGFYVKKHIQHQKDV